MIRRMLAAVIGGLLVAACASRGTTTGSAAPPGAVSSAGGLVSPASPLAPAVSSPAPAASSPVDVGSETPPPLPTPVFGSEGTLPPMPSGGRSLDASDPDSVWAAQNVIDVFAQEVGAVAQNSADYCDVAVDGFHDGLTVWWHGIPTAATAGVLVRARHAGITVAVLPAAFERAPLNAAIAVLVDRMQQLGMSELSLSNDCSGLKVGLIVLTPAGEAAIKAVVGPGIPVKFEEMAPPSPA
jgi:hypothetical protein